jgi:hypothetical protein
VVVLLGLLGVALATFGAKRAGYFAFLEPPEFTGRVSLGDGDVIVEQVDLAWPPARLVVARIPRGRGYRLRAVLTDPKAPLLKPVSAVAKSAGALVAVNGDYHYLEGVCASGPYSTLIDQGHAHTLGSPFGYAAQFWLDSEGLPHVSRMDLGARVVREDGASLAVAYNGGLGDALLVDRHPPVWTSDEHLGLPLNAGPGPGQFVVGGPLTQRFASHALLVKHGSPAHTFALESLPTNTLRLERTGTHTDAPFAIGTGPHLVAGGVVRGEALDAKDRMGWVARLPRTAVGFNSTHVLLVTTLQAPRCGLSLLELAKVMKALGCDEALNLDGGPSTTLWAKLGGLGGRVVNVPRGISAEQPVGTALLVLPPADGDPGVR